MYSTLILNKILPPLLFIIPYRIVVERRFAVASRSQGLPPHSKINTSLRKMCGVIGFPDEIAKEDVRLRSLKGFYLPVGEPESDLAGESSETSSGNQETCNVV